MSIAKPRPKEQTNANHHDLALVMARVEKEVGRHFPEALDALKVALAVAAVGCLSHNTQPTALHLVGQPSAGKTLPLEFMMPEGDDDPLAKFFYRSDNFTAASFVSHKADDDEKKLQEKDLLPKIKDKTLLTPELAALFRGKRGKGRVGTLVAILADSSQSHCAPFATNVPPALRYVTLNRMAEKGYSTSRQEEQPPGAIGPPRRHYRATGYGVKVFNAYRSLAELTLKPAMGSALMTVVLWGPPPTPFWTLPRALAAIAAVLGITALAFRWWQVRRLPWIVTRAPAGWMSGFVEFVFSKKTFEGVFEPLIAEQAFEWMEVVADNRVWKLRWLRVKHPFDFALHILAQWPLSAVKTIMTVWKL